MIWSELEFLIFQGILPLKKFLFCSFNFSIIILIYSLDSVAIVLCLSQNSFFGFCFAISCTLWNRKKVANYPDSLEQIRKKIEFRGPSKICSVRLNRWNNLCRGEIVYDRSWSKLYHLDQLIWSKICTHA